MEPPNTIPDGASVPSRPSAFEREALAAIDSLYRTARRLSRDQAGELVEILGHEGATWSSGDRRFVLIARGSRDEVAHMASFVKGALQ